MAEENSLRKMPGLARYKRIILCSDGTWLASDQGGKSVPSNVAKIARAIASNGIDCNGDLVKQIVLYHSGLGTGDLPFQKAIYGGIGWGLDVDVCEIYDFISNNYETGDELFFFGFSRGAFTVRSVAGLVCDIGVLSAVHMSSFPEMWQAYRSKPGGEPFQNSDWYQVNEEKLSLKNVKIKVIGVWDTVGALGIPEWPLVSTLQKAGIPINKQYAFHNVNLSKNVEYAFQAIAINEKRITFPPTLWQRTAGHGPAKDLQQCWFPGVHSNIGGQAEDERARGDYEEIGNITFAWMVDNLSGMLTFDDVAIENIINDNHLVWIKNGIRNGWGCGPIVDNFSGLEGAIFWLLGRGDRTPGAYGTIDTTNESFHPVTRIRHCEVSGFRPYSLHAYSPEEAGDGIGWKWIGKDVQEVPEFVISGSKFMSVVCEDGEIRNKQSLSRRLCPTRILSSLDRDNGISKPST